MLTLDKIYHAAYVLKPVARKTDVIYAAKLSQGYDLYLKTENLQLTGSFKLRGAYYKISQLNEEQAQSRHYCLLRGQPRAGCRARRVPHGHQGDCLYARRRAYQQG